MHRWLLAATMLLVVATWQARTPVVPMATNAAGQGVQCRVPIASAGPLSVAQGAVNLPPFRLEGGAQLTPRAALRVDAVVLGNRRYRFGREADYSPLDLALGWGPMADPAVHGQLGIRQSGRWYHFRWGADGPPIPAAEIISFSSNMHMIPSSPTVARRLLALNDGDRVAFGGWLVDLATPDGLAWRTSLSRTDSGDGACEIVYVCDVRVLPLSARGGRAQPGQEDAGQGDAHAHPLVRSRGSVEQQHVEHEGHQRLQQ